MRAKSAENQFSFSVHGKQTFKATHFPCRNSLLRQTIYINKTKSNETSLTKRGITSMESPAVGRYGNAGS